MREMTLEEYEAQARSVVFDTMALGDVVRVDCGDAGAFIIMEEPEYQVMRDALTAIMRLGVDGKLPDEFRRFVK